MKSAHRFPGIALATAVASVGSGLVAADESVYFSELPVVASVSRLPQRLADAPTAVTVIDRDMIKASGVRDLNDVFRLVPGFQTYPHTTEPARVSYHGLNDEDYSPRVQVLIDGRSMYSPLFGNGVNWATIPVALDDIERIEVVRLHFQPNNYFRKKKNWKLPNTKVNCLLGFQKKFLTKNVVFV